jgi:hypothetical protein
MASRAGGYITYTLRSFSTTGRDTTDRVWDFQVAVSDPSSERDQAALSINGVLLKLFAYILLAAYILQYP